MILHLAHQMPELTKHNAVEVALSRPLSHYDLVRNYIFSFLCKKSFIETQNQDKPYHNF